MRINLRRKSSILLAIGFLAVLFIGCNQNQYADSSGSTVTTLKIVSEYGTDAVHGGASTSESAKALQSVVDDFNNVHDDIKIELTFLPMDESERDITLQRLRTEIMSGKGPDIFLLPTGYVAGEPDAVEQTLSIPQLEPLFSDVEQAMRNRLFYDLSEFYDNDADLKAEELQPDIMNAGIYDGARYVLPIGYTMPIAAIDHAALQEIGMSENAFSVGISEIIEEALRTGNPAAIWCSRILPYNTLCFFPNLIDYNTNSVVLTLDELLDYAEKVQLARAASADYQPQPSTLQMFGYLSQENSVSFALDGACPFRLTDLSLAAQILGMAKCEGRDISIIPIGATDGSRIAEVTYFGAINANCEFPEEAYRFLRIFLGEEVQHQKSYGETSLLLNLSDSAWPVRTAGSVEAKWNAALQTTNTVIGDNGRRRSAERVILTDEDLPLINEHIDTVRFSTVLTYEFSSGNPIPFDTEETQKALRTFLEHLNYHIAES